MSADPAMSKVTNVTLLRSSLWSPLLAIVGGNFRQWEKSSMRKPYVAGVSGTGPW